MDRIRRGGITALSVLTAICLSGGVALAAGWSSGLQSARSMALGNAYHAVADTPVAIYFNPAGIAQIKSPFAAQLGVHVPFLLNYSVEYDYTPADGTPGDHLRNESTKFPVIPHIFLTASYKFLTFGLGWYIPQGGGDVRFDGLKLDPNDPNNLTNIQTSLAIHYISPTIAANFFDVVHVGAQLNILISDVKLSQENYPKESVAAPGTYNYIDNSFAGKGVAFGAVFGLLVKDPWWKRVRFGFVYKLGYDIETKGDTTFDVRTPIAKTMFKQLGLVTPQTFDSSVHFRIPQIFNWGVSVKPIDRLLVSFSVDYTLWSETDKLVLDWHGLKIPNDILKLKLLSPTVELKSGNENVLSLMGGVEFKVLGDNLPVRVGFLYNPAAKADIAQSVTGIDTTAYIVCYGAGYRVDLPRNMGLNIDLGFYNYFGKKTTVTKEQLSSNDNKVGGKETGLRIYGGPAGTYNKTIHFGALLDLTLTL